MLKLFYFMNVDIAWIKQRPHFLADELSKRFNIKVFYPYFFNRKVLVNINESYNYKTEKIIRLPNAIRSKKLHSITDNLGSHIIKKEIAEEKPEILYFCDPKQVNFIPEAYTGIIVYDCMDDLLAMTKTKEEKKCLLENEENIINRSHIVLVSSNELKNTIIKRYGNSISYKLLLVRNAFNGDIKPFTQKERNSDKKRGLNLCYFGTISHWFDFDLIHKSLLDFDNIEYTLIGPIIEGVKIPNSPRVHYLGIIKHEDLWSKVKKCDAFIMPFKLNNIVKSVDPVKFYEYINFNKNIISVYYQEVNRYSKFVMFYNNYIGYKNNIINLFESKDTIYSMKDRVKFLKENTWIKRAESVENKIMEIYKTI